MMLARALQPLAVASCGTFLLAAAPHSAGGEPRPPLSLLAAVPEDAYALLHVGDPRGLRMRAERNEWMTLLASADGRPALLALQQEYESSTGTDFDRLLAVALELEGQALLFFTGRVAGFLSAPPTERAPLAAALDGWLTEPRSSVEVAGAHIQLAPWPQPPGPAGDGAARFLALCDHPQALGLYSGDSSEAVLSAITDSLAGLQSGRRARVIEGFLAAGGGTAGGIEAYVDFTPFVAAFEETLRAAVAGVLPDPSGVLGLELGTSLFLSADVAPGAQLECSARLRIPPGTLGASLADSFEPLPLELPGDLPEGTWALGALDWNVGRFYATARAGFEGVADDGLPVVDQGMATVEALSGVHPIKDVIDQLSGLFAWYHVLEQVGQPPTEAGVGFLAGLVDEHRLLDALETLLETGGLGAEVIELEGAETHVAPDLLGPDGGLSILPRHLLLSVSRATLARGLRALQRVAQAGLGAGSELRAALKARAGACAFGYAELAPLRALAFPAGLAPAENDPFDSRLIFAVHRVAAGFEARLHTR